MVTPGRQYSAGSGYRYGFNGKEKDKDISNLTAYDYGFRIYNPGIGRFMSVDPLSQSYPWYTPYQFSGNSPILNVDIDGLEESSTQPNTQPLNPDERFQEFYETSKKAADVFRKAVRFSPPLRVIQSASAVINIFAHYKISRFDRDEKSAEEAYDKTKQDYDRRNLDHEAHIYYAKLAGIYKSDLSDETNVRNFILDDKFVSYSRKVDKLFNQLENEKFSKLAELIKKQKYAADQKAKWEVISTITGELIPSADIKNDVESITQILNEKDEKKRVDKIIDFVTDKLIDRLFDEYFKVGSETPESRKRLKDGFTNILSRE